ncbi:ribosomal protection-like ABC-F family protein [Candidatus Enterococcus mangumiae]|uniref:Macrolide transport system ATP-binding/permease n=1 Tax=Candidatus Enterococcus mangumiae TaxID=2230878 RepID=A0ABZ2SU10_9ENTE|nr:ABC-F type ribosomal protection protein [Enterococcus sp. DIV1094]MBO0489390.1 ABC-F type ribosomal protection protein [Enterococcus sp. DIV1094]
MEALAVKLKDIEISYDGKEILAIKKQAIYENARIGIVGDNGSGKSTLLKLLAGEIDAEKGRVDRRVDFHYFAQIEALEQNPIAEIDFELLSRFQVPDQTAHFSGGEETKYRLAQVLSTYTPGILLDEPTTHLDQRSVQMLIEELRYYYGTLIFVSHDRLFLNELADKIWEVSEQTIKEYQGNYDDYLKQKEQEAIAQENAHDDYLRERKKLENSIIKKEQQAKKLAQSANQKSRSNKNSRKPDRLSGTKQKESSQKSVMRAAKSIEKRLEKLTEVASVQKDRPIDFPQSKTTVLHNKFPVAGESVTLRYEEKILLDQVDFAFDRGKKIAIIGSNGSGKSSLLRHILQQKNGVKVSPKVIFAVYEQMDYHLVEDVSVLQYLLRQTEYPESLIRSMLHHLAFSSETIHRSVCALSGGEATRLSLAVLFAKPSNVLILDEPTNFIDLRTMNALAYFLKQYHGTVLFTSHDPYFVQQVADQIYEINDQKLIRRD